jgi:hypothetical protein
VSERREIVYAAQTAACTFYLDTEGICVEVAVARESDVVLATSYRSVQRTAAQCVGAQYVASVDPRAAGLLSELPRAGAAMLFARVDESGRVSLLRSGPLIRFESYETDNPFAERPSESIQTSAPDLSTFARQRTSPPMTVARSRIRGG